MGKLKEAKTKEGLDKKLRGLNTTDGVKTPSDPQKISRRNNNHKNRFKKRSELIILRFSFPRATI